jgi:coenzyme F420-dependent glucose-6-phosphate dehydrogenase
MLKLAYHCSLEQFSPKDMLELALEAQQAGFKHLSCSDHFAPWSQSQGHSANAWCWMSTALANTNMTCGLVTTAGYRYHPGIIAQMSATLAQMFPGRFWLALGSGEYLNEQFTGMPWPDKETRNEILKESALIIRALLRGQEVTHCDHLNIESAKLYSLPEKEPDIYGAALTTTTAKYISSFTDGLITTGTYEKVKEIVDKYRLSAPNKKMIFKLDFSYASTKDKAIELGFEQWRYTQLDSTELSELRFPEQFEEAAQKITVDKFVKKTHIVTSIEQLKEIIERFSALGFEQINLHNVNKQQLPFIQAFKKNFF